MGKVDTIQSGQDVTITIDGNTADITVGGNGQNGNFIVKDKTNQILSELRAGQFVMTSAEGKQRLFIGNIGADFHLGGNGANGDISLHPSSSTPGVFGQLPQPSIRMYGETGELKLNTGDKNRIRFEPSRSAAFFGGNGQAGDVVLFQAEGDNNSAAKSTIHLDGAGANIWLGGNGIDSDLLLMPSTATDNHDRNQATIWLDGENGDILLQNADCAEDFDISETEVVDPGTVMVFDQGGSLQPSSHPYDKRVAGVISGAGDCKPGIVLDKKNAHNTRLPLALVGKAYCKADAKYGAIEVGDLLTTSPTRGHAMKVTDHPRAFGTVIGKAMNPLSQGQGLILILIALQ